MPEPRYVTAAEAAQALGISLASLYSYVSRGMLRSERTDGERRERRYRWEDVQRLKDRQKLRRNPDLAASGALQWGTPVLPSGLTLISEGKLYYRGRDALRLAEEASYEQVAGLLWTGDLSSPFEAAGARGSVQLHGAALASLRSAATGASLPALEAMQVALAAASAADPARYDLRPASLLRAGAGVLALLVAVASGESVNGSEGLAGALVRHWLPDEASDPSRATRLVNAALVLCADHELNVSAFTARCVASAGAPLYAAVSAGLGALQGVRHGAVTARVEALIRETSGPADAGRVLAGRLERGDGIPGFGHPLYPEGDPRGRLLLDLVADAFPASPAVALAGALAREAERLLGERPTIDLALVVMARALGLADGTAIALFALGRTAGWIAHAMEQYASGQLIRPRASYTGPAPAAPDGAVPSR